MIAIENSEPSVINGSDVKNKDATFYLVVMITEFQIKAPGVFETTLTYTAKLEAC